MQYKWVALSVTSVGTLMAAIDARIVIVGLPTVARELGADVESAVWITQAYLLATTLSLLLIGRVTDLFGRVKIYNIGFIIFTVGSALASLSFNPAELIASRLVQGTGAAMLITNSAAILTDASPQGELGTIIGINQIAFRVGSVLGLTLSGVILVVADWRALFYINIPIGIFGTVWAHLRLREISTKDPAKKMDWVGFASFASGITLVLLGIAFFGFGPTYLGLGGAMAAGGLAMILLFVKIESMKSAPLLDIRLLRIKEFTGGCVAQMLNAVAWSGTLIMLSFFMQIIYGFTPFQTGISILPLDATFVIFGPLAGKLSDKHGARLFATVGICASSAGFFLISTITQQTSYVQIAISLAILGVGNGLFVSPNISSVMGSVPANRRGVASGFRTTLFNVGMTASSGIAVLIMTLGIPYPEFSALISNTISPALVQTAKQNFVSGFRIAALVLAVINTAGVVPSFLRGPKLAAPQETIKDLEPQ
jgi:EmrB/QacA subfamily drug resistance transporter